MFCRLFVGFYRTGNDTGFELLIFLWERLIAHETIRMYWCRGWRDYGMKGWLWSRRQEIRDRSRGSVTAPGCSKKIITVGSSDMLSGKRAVSGRGPTFECVCKPDLVAPGRQIMACTPGAGNLYSMKSGTSMSTPLVSGAIALALEKDSLLSNVEIKMMLRDSCDDMGLPRNQQGWGKFNCKKFLAL